MTKNKWEITILDALTYAFIGYSLGTRDYLAMFIASCCMIYSATLKMSIIPEVQT